MVFQNLIILNWVVIYWVNQLPMRVCYNFLGSPLHMRVCKMFVSGQLKDFAVASEPISLCKGNIPGMINGITQTAVFQRIL